MHNLFTTLCLCLKFHALMFGSEFAADGLHKATVSRLRLNEALSTIILNLLLLLFLLLFFLAVRVHDVLICFQDSGSHNHFVA